MVRNVGIQSRHHKETYLVFAIDGITATDTSSRSRTRHGSARSIVAPVRSTLSVWAVSRHMSRISTDPTDDVGSKVALLGAVELAMTDLTTCKDVSECIKWNRKRQ